jgi:FixJ family two-component response regulator
MARGLMQRKARRATGMIAIVDDDAGVREATESLLRSFGFSTACFASAEAFLISDCDRRTRCLILDIGLPGLSGLELQEYLIRSGLNIPIVLISGRLDQEACIEALASNDGAMAFLSKPFTEEDLLHAVNTAFVRRAGTEGTA